MPPNLKNFGENKQLSRSKKVQFLELNSDNCIPLSVNLFYILVHQ